MDYIIDALREALNLIFRFDAEIARVVWSTLYFATVSTLLAAVIGVPAGILFSRVSFKGKAFFSILLNTLLGAPTVVIGLLVYSLISRQGPLGRFGLLFTDKGIILGQVVLILPLVIALVRNALHEIDERMYETAISLGATVPQRFKLILAEARYGIFGAVIAGYGRVIGEVGIAMMLGGNIRGVTRTITTAIALETNKGRFSFGIALGLILMLIYFVINLLIHYFQTGENR